MTFLRRAILFLLAGLTPLLASENLQDPVIDESRLKPKPATLQAFVVGHLHVDSQTTHSPGVLVINRGRVITAGDASTTIPAGAEVHRHPDEHLYPGLIDLSARYGFGPAGQKMGVVERDRYDDFDPKTNNQLPKTDFYRACGFTSLVHHGDEPVFGGQAPLLSLAQGSKAGRLINRGSLLTINMQRARGAWPNSLMGVLAHYRQEFGNARHQVDNSSVARGQDEGQARTTSLDILAATVTGKRPALVRGYDDWDALRFGEVASHHKDLNWIYEDNGNAWRRAQAIAKLNIPCLLPLNFPQIPGLDTELARRSTSLRTLKEIANAPSNAARCRDAGIQVVLSAGGLPKARAFHRALARVRDNGFSDADILKALTQTPATLLGEQDRRGHLHPSALADFFLASEALANDDCTVQEVFVAGRLSFRKRPPADVAWGHWQLTFDNGNKALLHWDQNDSGTIKAHLKLGKKNIVFKKPIGARHRHKANINGGPFKLGKDAVIEFLLLDGTLQGTISNDKKSLKFTGIANDGAEDEHDNNKRKRPETTDFAPVYPDGAYGGQWPPTGAKEWMITEATVWTCGAAGKIESCDVHVRNGKIIAIGNELRRPTGIKQIDGRGLHVTPGLIDCHSHSGISRGVNESSRSNTSNVRIADVVNPDDINLWRGLAGGLTCINQLHGSANVIGGQNSVLKLRWGATAEEMKFGGAKPGIKFALGENVKQSNWGNEFKTRYPQSRLGVEAWLRDQFQEAMDYRTERQRHPLLTPRNYAKDTLVEILESRRLVHCHSYRHDEILMLMRVAESFNFRIGTFQHALESYKIADEIRKHGAGVSTFSDWWAYKVEAFDAVPYNGAFMHKAGVVTSFNSDSGEVARHMNLEAAKAVKYGGLKPEEALKLVTSAPARQLAIDNRVGTVEPGKDADIVLWSAMPLSTRARALSTWIDGYLVYSPDIADDRLKRDRNEKKRIIDYLLALKKAAPKDDDDDDEKGDKPRRPREDDAYSCCDYKGEYK